MDWLAPPFQFVHPPVGHRFTLPVRSWEIGTMTRRIAEPPFYVTRPGIRLHLAPPLPADLFLYVATALEGEGDRVDPRQLRERPYLDFTNRVLIGAFLELYRRKLGEVIRPGGQVNIDMALAVDPEGDEPLTLTLTRRGTGRDTVYEVELELV